MPIQSFIRMSLYSKHNHYSVKYSLHIILPLVIPSRTPVINTTIDQVLTVERHLRVAPHTYRVEPLLQLLYRLTALYETRHRLPVTAIH